MGAKVPTPEGEEVIKLLKTSDEAQMLEKLTEKIKVRGAYLISKWDLAQLGFSGFDKIEKQFQQQSGQGDSKPIDLVEFTMAFILASKSLDQSAKLSSILEILSQQDEVIDRPDIVLGF